MLRRTPMKRSSKPLRRTRLKPKSRKRAKEDRALDDRPEFNALFGYCFICLDGGGKLETHHISGRTGPLRHHRANLFRVCSHCHETKLTNPVTPKGQPLAMTALDKLAMQLAYKLARDPRGYDRDIVLRIKRFDENAIPQSQVETLAGNIRKGL